MNKFSSTTPSRDMQSARVNYTPESEKAVNEAIHLHKQAAHTYDHLAATCATEEFSMPGFCKFFRLCSQRQRKLAEHWINFQTMRGGKVCVPEVKPLWQCGDLSKDNLEKFVQIALDTEKRIEEYLRHVHQIARSKDEDIVLAEYIEKKLMLPQLHVIKMMANHTNGLRVSQNAYLYDRTTMMALAKKMRHQLTERNVRDKECCRPFRSRTSTGVSAFIYPF